MLKDQALASWLSDSATMRATRVTLTQGGEVTSVAVSAGEGPTGADALPASLQFVSSYRGSVARVTLLPAVLPDVLERC